VDHSASRTHALEIGGAAGDLEQQRQVHLTDVGPSWVPLGAPRRCRDQMTLARPALDRASYPARLDRNGWVVSPRPEGRRPRRAQPEPQAETLYHYAHTVQGWAKYSRVVTAGGAGPALEHPAQPSPIRVDPVHTLYIQWPYGGKP